MALNTINKSSTTLVFWCHDRFNASNVQDCRILKSVVKYDCSGNEIKESQILELQGPWRHFRRIWEQRPVWMRTIYSGDEG